jgi:hypothetical protein
MGAHVLLSLAVENSSNSKPEGKVDSLPLLGLDSATFGTPTHSSRPLSQVSPCIHILSFILFIFVNKKMVSLY